MPSPFTLPLHALRLAGKCALPLVLWFSAGQLVRWILLYVMAETSHGSMRQLRLVGTNVLMTLIVLVTMTMITGMFLTLRRALRVREAAGEADEPFWAAMNRVAPAFALIYLAWELYLADYRDFLQMDYFHNLDDNFYAPILNGHPEEVTFGRGMIDLDWRISLAAMAVAFLLRALFTKMVEKGSGRFSGLAVAFSEFAFMFCGLTAVFTFAKMRSDWTEHRAVVESTTDLLAQAKSTIPGWEQFSGWVQEIWPYVIDALAVPLTWLAIAVLVFGGSVDDTRRALTGTRAVAGVDRLESSHTITQKAVDRVIGGFQERWIPVVNAFRVTIRGGAVLFGLMCLFYVGLHVGADYADRGVRTLIGSSTPFMWLVVSWPVMFVKDLLLTVLTYAMLAATFDLAASRARARGEDITA
ncbi:MAG: hypothetical protein HOY71_30460 [Nonomuraea sp.]|nr:hypothetical protein [Nonomuraea sp.]